MSSKTREQKLARALQKHTGWSYTECLRAARGPAGNPEMNPIVHAERFAVWEKAIAELRAKATGGSDT